MRRRLAAAAALLSLGLLGVAGCTGAQTHRAAESPAAAGSGAPAGSSASGGSASGSSASGSSASGSSASGSSASGSSASGSSASGGSASGGSASGGSASGAATDPFAAVLSGPHLRPGSDPAVLPGPVLIADKLNNRLVVVDPRGRLRWVFPRPGDLAKGQTFTIPDDAFFTPDGRYIVATEEDAFVITLIDVARHRIVWRYGLVGQPGAGPDRLWNPDDALVLPDGWVLSADIKNCRVVLIRPGWHTLARSFGQPGRCLHDPPRTFGSPNGAFPMSDGRYLVTEINGDWVDALSLDGTVAWSTHPPGVLYPSDTNEVAPGRYLTADYSDPGQLVEFDRQGRLMWRFRPSGRDALAKPSLALPLPNGDVIANDDANHRVIVVDPRTDRVVWQYGVTGVPGHAPGYLDNPDGLDLVPPHSLLASHAATMGLP